MSPPNLPDSELYMTLGDNMARIRSGKTYKPITPADIREFRKTGAILLSVQMLCHTCECAAPALSLPLEHGGHCFRRCTLSCQPVMPAHPAGADKVPHMTASVTCVKPHHAQFGKPSDYSGCEEMPVMPVHRKCGATIARVARAVRSSSKLSLASQDASPGRLMMQRRQQLQQLLLIHPHRRLHRMKKRTSLREKKRTRRSVWRSVCLKARRQCQSAFISVTLLHVAS